MDVKKTSIRKRLGLWFSTFPRFLLIESADQNKPISSLSPFAISKSIAALAGEPKMVKKLRSGALLVEVTRKSHSTNLLRSTIFINIPIKVSPHRSLNTKRGIIRCRDFENENDQTIASELKDQGVIEVRRIFAHRNGSKHKTNTFIVTFNTPNLPSTIKAGYLSLRVDLYVPNPLRCFKCQRFGHHQDHCRAESACVQCGKQGHDGSACSDTPSCKNCGGEHSSNSKDCSTWKKEKSFQQIRYSKNISYFEAKRHFEATQPAPALHSYAAVAAPKPTAPESAPTIEKKPQEMLKPKPIWHGQMNRKHLQIGYTSRIRVRVCIQTRNHHLHHHHKH